MHYNVHRLPKKNVSAPEKVRLHFIGTALLTSPFGIILVGLTIFNSECKDMSTHNAKGTWGIEAE